MALQPFRTRLVAEIFEELYLFPELVTEVATSITVPTGRVVPGEIILRGRMPRRSFSPTTGQATVTPTTTST